MIESATKEIREAKVKAKKAIQESNGKRQDERTKTSERGTRNETRRTTKNEEETKKGEKKRKTARVSGRYYVDYLGLNRGDAS